jgi:hypothetical protein
MRSYLSNRGDNPTSLTTFSDGATTRSKAQRGGLLDPAFQKIAEARPVAPRFLFNLVDATGSR